MAIQIGDRAPNFTLFNSEKEQVSLESLRGKTVVLQFFPQAFTGVCTTQLCTVRDHIGVYQNEEVATLGISVDSPFTLAEFKNQQHYNFPLLSDFNKEVSQEYGALYDEFAFGMKGVSRRAAFVIDKEGVVKYAEVLESAGDLPDFEKVQAAITEANA